MHYIVYIKPHASFHSFYHIDTLVFNSLNFMFL
jgi:hypothetical protein